MTPKSSSRRKDASIDHEWNKALAAIAAGFAHDANNCLTGIFSMSDLCLAQVDSQNPLHESLSLIRESAGQASTLLQRLTRLVYDTPGTPTYHDLNALAADAADIVRRALPRNIEIVLVTSKGQLPVLVDAVETRKAIIHLVLRAAACLNGPGKITFTTTARGKLCKLTVATAVLTKAIRFPLADLNAVAD